MAKKQTANTTTTFPFKPGDSVLAKITAYEAKKGIFIPGHRFEPLRNHDLVPRELILNTETNKTLAIKTELMKFSDTAVFHKFFGSHELFMVLCSDQKMNLKAIEAAHSESDNIVVRVSVFDCSKFFQDENIGAGDYLKLSLADNEGRRFAVSAVRAKDIPEEYRTAWFKALESSFQDASDAAASPPVIPRFMREAYSRMPHEMRQNPAGTFGEFVEHNHFLAFTEYAGIEYLWPVSRDIRSDLRSGGLPVSDNPLDKLLNEFSLSITREDITAFTLDALSRNESIETISDRCFRGYSYSPEDASGKVRQLLLLVEKHAKTIEAGYDAKKDKNAARIRSRILPLYERFLVWLREIETVAKSVADLPQEPFIELSGLMREIAQLVEALNRSGSADDIDPGILGNYGEIEQSAIMLMEEIDKGIRTRAEEPGSMDNIIDFPARKSRPGKRTRGKKPTQPT